MRQKMTDKRTFCIEEQTGEMIDDIAQRVGTSPSEVIRECITKYLPKLRSEVEKQEDAKDVS